MYLKQCSNLFFCAQRLNHPLLKFSFLTSHNFVLNFKRQTASAETIPDRINDSLCPVKRGHLYANYFHEYLLKNKEKYDLFSPEDMNFKEETKMSLKLLNDLVNNSEETLQEIPEELEASIHREIHDCTFDEICKYTFLISKLSISSKRTLITYLDTLIPQKSLSLKDALKILYIIRSTSIGPVYSKLLWKIILKLYDRVNKLSSEEKVVFFFSLFKLDPIRTKQIKYNFITCLMETVPKLNSDELGIIARGFQICLMNPLGNKFIEVFINKTITEKKNFNEISLNMVLKMIAANVNLKNMNDIHNLQEEFTQLIPTLKNTTVLLLARVGSSLGFVNSSFWEVLVKYFKENFDRYTSFEAIRLVHLTSIFGYYDDELFQKTIQKVEAETDISSESLVLFLSSLALHQVYPEKLLHRVLSKDFRLPLTKNKNFSVFSRYLYALLHCCVEIDFPTNNFMLMDDIERKNYYKSFIYSKYNKNKTNVWFTATCSAEKILVDEYGENTVIKMTCVPYDDTGLVMRFDKNFKVQEIPQEFKQCDKLHIKKALKDDHFWIFIKLLDNSLFSISNGEPNLKTQNLIRHLKQLGYIPICIKCRDWICWRKEGVQTESLLNTVQKNLQDWKRHTVEISDIVI